MADSTIGVVLMSFGAAATPQDVPAYLTHVRGTPAPPDLIAEFQRRYRKAGGSPLLRNTWAQAMALEALLTAEGQRFRVVVGMRHAPPFVDEALARLASEGVSRVIAVILSPQYSPIIMGGYHRALDRAQSVLGPGCSVRVAGAWHTLPSFIGGLTRRVQEALEKYPPDQRHQVPVLMTAHSLPKRVADQEPEYLEQLQQTAQALAQQAGLDGRRWQFAYQSAGHTPEEWLTPDIKDLFPSLRAAGHRRALVVPIQFLADHLEVLYDIDVAAKEQAKEAGIELRRIESPGVMPELIQALAQVVQREVIGLS